MVSIFAFTMLRLANMKKGEILILCFVSKASILKISKSPSLIKSSSLFLG